MSNSWCYCTYQYIAHLQLCVCDLCSCLPRTGTSVFGGAEVQGAETSGCTLES